MVILKEQLYIKILVSAFCAISVAACHNHVEKNECQLDNHDTYKPPADTTTISGQSFLAGNPESIDSLLYNNSQLLFSKVGVLLNDYEMSILSNCDSITGYFGRLKELIPDRDDHIEQWKNNTLVYNLGVVHISKDFSSALLAVQSKDNSNADSRMLRLVTYRDNRIIAFGDLAMHGLAAPHFIDAISNRLDNNHFLRVTATSSDLINDGVETHGNTDSTMLIVLPDGIILTQSVSK
ncbi:MAG: hypothetical protein MJY60_07865 [Bacteroidales bacterium]|nr:hypothetical protein [Bacteroidales bacterium]